MAGKVNPMQGYQEATNQLLAINEQRKSNNAQAKMEETLQAAQNNTLAQASEFVASQNPQITVQPANLNPATQNILGQYGLGQPKIQKTSSSSQQVTKQNITINNKNTTITNNNVSVPANSGGPIQGRPIQFQDPGQIKFKTWLSNSFAQQNELAAKRQREYEKRDSALVRNSNKLMKKLEETGKSIATGLNPKNMASNMGSQLKTLLMVFGFARLAKEWPNLMTRVDEISKKVSEIKDNVFKFFDKNGGLSKMLGGKEGEGPLTALKNLFFDKNDGIFAYIRTWLSARMGERREAIKTLAKPDMSWNVGDGVGNNISRILGSVVGYLGDILSAIIDPTSAARNTVKATAERAETEYQDNNQKTLRENRANVVITDENGRSKGIATSAGDQAIVEGRYQGVKPGSVDSQGNLTNNPISSIAQGNELMRAIDDSRRTGNLQTATVATGFARLHNAAQENGKVVLTEEFLSHYLGGQEGIRELGLQKGNYRYIVRPKTKEEMAMDLLSISHENEELRKWLTGIGMFTGGVVSGPGGVILGGLGGNGIGKLVEKYKKWGLPETVVELRPAGAEADYSKGERYVEGQNPQNLYEVTPEQLQNIIDKITGKENINVDLNSADFMRSVESSLITQDTPLRVNRDIDIDQTYRVNDMVERNNAQLQTLRENSRANTAVNNTKDVGRGLFNNAKDRVSGIISPEKVKKVNPSNIDSGDLSGVIEASKRGVFYSDSSGGYIPLGADLSGFMHKCTSGPATFYDDGTGGKIKLNGKWWNTGSPKTATGTNIDKEGFKLVWNGTAEQGWDTSRIKATGFELQPGDIMLNFGRGKNGNSSHAQMWNGEEWISDTHQGQRSFVYRGGGRLGDKSAQIWRYDAGIEKQNIDLASSEVEADGLLDQEDVNSGFTAFENEQLASNVLPEIDVTPSSINTPIPEYTATVDYSSANISNDYPGVFSNGGAKGNNNFTSTSKENPNYTADLNSIVADLKTMLGVLNIMGQTDAQTLEATNNVVSAVGSLRSNNNQPSIPYAPSFTDGQYNQNPRS
jgi:hypothetical protein